MFTCTAPVTAPLRPHLVVQTLLSVSFASSSDKEDDDNRVSHWSRYQKACAQLLAVFSHVGERDDDGDQALDPAENRDYQILVKGISSSLLTMLDALLCGDRSQVRRLKCCFLP